MGGKGGKNQTKAGTPGPREGGVRGFVERGQKRPIRTGGSCGRKKKDFKKRHQGGRGSGESPQKNQGKGVKREFNKRCIGVGPNPGGLNREGGGTVREGSCGERFM